MIWDVVACGDRERWAAALARVGCRDPYYLAAYHDAYGYDGGQSLLYVAESGGETLIHPFRLHSITQIGFMKPKPGLHDIESVYGYAGPLATSDDPAFLAEAWAGFDLWQAERQVVSEFCRFHPLLRSERFAHPRMTVLHDRDVVTLDLSRGAEALWAEYPSIQRNCVRKAQAGGLICRRLDYTEGAEAFRGVYLSTMRDLGATGFYDFSPAYWQALERLGDALAVLAVEKDGTIIAAGLFLLGGDVAHYHLSGSLPEHRALCPNNLMLHEAALWAMERGAGEMLLGGGRTTRRDDSLFKFKHSISRQVTPFFIGKRICAPDAYARLSALWSAQADKAAPPVLQHYRLPVGGD